MEDWEGDLFAEPVDALVNPVNCVGVMGKGLALAFKTRFPANFAMYQLACERGQVRPGKILVHGRRLDPPFFILNFPTKRHWRDDSLLSDIEEGLRVGSPSPLSLPTPI